MIPWSRYPFVRLVIPLVVGIIISSSTGFGLRIPEYFLFALLLPLGMLAAWPRRFINYRNRWLFGLIMGILCLLAGVNAGYLANGLNSRDYFLHSWKEGDLLVMRIESEPELKNGNIRFIVRIQGIYKKPDYTEAEGEVLAYIKTSALDKSLTPGDVIAARANAKEPYASGNPLGFDYRRYLQLQGVYHQLFIPDSSVVKLGYAKGRVVQLLATRIRVWMIDAFARHGFNGRELAIVSALVLGYSRDLDNEVKLDFTSSGTMHILCVSGMHVAIIFFVIGFLLKPLDRIRYGRYVRNILVLACVWLYAVIAGLTPSVLRSAVMFSFIIAGSFPGMKISIYNNLAASAFLLLLMDPKMLFHPGFQFSYLAVLSIVMLHPYIYSLSIIRNPLADKAWSLVSVSVAAQIGTAPLSIWYFHMFPNYFIPGNLIAIPLSTISLYLSVAYLAVYPIEAAGTLVMKALYFMVNWMAGSVAFIGQLPHSVSKGIWIPGTSVLLVYLLLGIIYYAIYYRSYRTILPITAVCALLTLNYSIFNAGSRLRQEFVVFNAGRSRLVSFYDGTTEHLYTMEAPGEVKWRKDYLENRRMRNRSTEFHFYRERTTGIATDTLLHSKVMAGKGFLLFNGETKTLMIITGRPDRIANKRLKVDVLVAGWNSGNPDEVFLCAEPGIVVLDATIGRKKSELYRQKCREAGIPCHSVREEGAYILGQVRWSRLFPFTGRRLIEDDFGTERPGIAQQE